MTADHPKNQWDQNQPPTWQWVLIGAIALIALCGITLFVVLGYRTYNRWNKDRRQAAAETAAVDVASATAIARERTKAIERAQSWPLLVEEPFESNVNEWMVGDIEDEYSKIKLALDGSYLWEATAKQGFVWRVWPRSDVVSDFYLAVEVQNRSRNERAQYGLVFRNNDDAYAYLEVKDTGYFRLMVYDGQTWEDLISSTHCDLIRKGEMNALAVVSIDDVYYILINGNYVGEAQGKSPSKGQAGVAIGLSSEGEGAIIVFDNFEIRAPKADK